MNRKSRWFAASAALTMVLLLAGCGSPHGGPAGHGRGMPKIDGLNVSQLGLIRQDRDLNGVLDQSQKVQDIKVCGTAPCVVNVVVAATAPPEPREGFDCGLSLQDAANTSKNADIVMLNRDAMQITWNLVPVAGSKLEFRFKKAAPTTRERNGISLYADPDQKEFGINVATASQVIATRLVRHVDQGYAYGVYVEWRASPTEPFTDCNPLDPIIIEHD